MENRTHWIETLQGWDKTKVVLWSAFAKKRYHVFETQINCGKGVLYAFKDVNKMSYTKVRTIHKELIEHRKNKK